MLARAADAPAKPAAAPAATAPTPAATAPSATATTTAAAPSTAPQAAPASLDNRIQDLKGDVIRLNRDLLVLEEELLFPANTQVALFVSMDVGKLFELDSVQIKLDDKVVTSYLYTPNEVQALHRGGVQRVYLGNLKAGTHEIVAFFTGKGPHDRDYKRGTTIKFDKSTDPKYIELRIKDSTGKLQPEFDVKVWQ
jgi:pyruvate/2-oxoglutarate dehydrogenase complex dihydrolipoamide acyltransferase (E2) component